MPNKKKSIKATSVLTCAAMIGSGVAPTVQVFAAPKTDRTVSTKKEVSTFKQADPTIAKRTITYTWGDHESVNVKAIERMDVLLKQMLLADDDKMNDPNETDALCIDFVDTDGNRNRLYTKGSGKIYHDTARSLIREGQAVKSEKEFKVWLDHLLKIIEDDNKTAENEPDKALKLGLSKQHELLLRNWIGEGSWSFDKEDVRKNLTEKILGTLSFYDDCLSAGEFAQYVTERNGGTIVVLRDDKELVRYQLDTVLDKDKDEYQIHAKTVGVDKYVTVTFDTAGGDMKHKSVVRAEGESLGYVEDIPVRKFFSFEGWVDSKDGTTIFDMNAPLWGDVTVYASWKAETRALNFETNGGTKVASMDVKIGETVRELPVTTKDGYKFVGWYDAAKDGVKCDEYTMPDKDATLYAYWEKESEPLTPIEPSTPVEPEKPDVPLTPIEPSTPVDPETPESRILTLHIDGKTFVFSDDKTIGDVLTDLDKFHVIVNKDAIVDVNITAKGDNNFDKASLSTSLKEIATFAKDKTDVAIDLMNKDGKVVIHVTYEETSKDEFCVVLDVKGSDLTPIEPSKPVDPEKPDVPLTPIEPSTPVEPEKPDVPLTPIEPSTPVDPEKPDEPDEPSKPVDPEKPDEKPVETRYTLYINNKKVTVSGDKTLDDLVNALKDANVLPAGFEATKYQIKNADSSIQDVSVTTNMDHIASQVQKGEALLIAYDKNGEALGSAKISPVKGSKTEFNVTFSKDVNQALKPLDGKGQGEADVKEPLSNEGKGNSVAESVHTADTLAIPLYGGLAGGTGVLLGGLAFLKKKFFK